MKRKLAIVQFDTPSTQNLLPLAAGILVSACKSNSLMSCVYDFYIETRRADVKFTASNFSAFDIVGFSTYMWNLQHSLSVARSLKDENPDTLVVFGGPSLPRFEHETEIFLRNYPFIDYVVIGEGEIAFTQLLSRILNRQPVTNVFGVAGITKSDNTFFYSPNRRIKSDIEFSPFLDRTFEDLFEAQSGRYGGALLETNRGCPYSCTFCDWSQATQSKVINVPMDRLEKELEWIASKKIHFIWITDANFGILPRDVDIARKIAQTKSNLGFPLTISVSWAKNTTDRVIQIQEILINAGIESRTTISMQSFDANVRRLVKRKNMKPSHFFEFKRRFSLRLLPTYTELIFPLPGETYYTFTKALTEQASTATNDFVAVFLCRLLTNTELSSKESREMYGLRSVKCRLMIGRRTYSNQGEEEFEEILVGTNVMSTKDWKRTFTFTYMFLALYNQRLVDVIVNFLRYQLDTNIHHFFEYFLQSLDAKRTPHLYNAKELVQELSETILAGETTVGMHPHIPSILWEPQELAYIEFAYNKRSAISQFKGIVKSYLNENSLTYEPRILDEVFIFQELLIPSIHAIYPIRRLFRYNWVKFYQSLQRCEPSSIDLADTIIDFSSEAAQFDFELNDQEGETPTQGISLEARFVASQVKVNSLGKHSLCSVNAVNH